jgi:hypothetical protein
MEVLIFIAVIVAAVLLLIVYRNAKGPSSPSSMSDEQIQRRMKSEGDWLNRYSSLPIKDQISIQAKAEGKRLYVKELMYELDNRQRNHEGDSMATLLQRALELVRNGVPDEAARKQAIEEHMAKREAKSAAAATAAK